MLICVKKLLKRKDGFTLVELMVTVVILGILGAATVTLITSIFESNIRSQQRLDQVTQVESLFGFMSSRIAVAQRPIGATKTSGCPNGASSCIEPLSIAGDQMMFFSGGNCYRVMYVKQPPGTTGDKQGQIWASISSNCEDSSIFPKRGPNEKIGGQGPGDFAADSPYYDKALDLPVGSTDAHIVLAKNINNSRPLNAPSDYPNPLRVFAYRDESNKDLNATSPHPNNYACSTGGAVPTGNCAVSDWYNTFSNKDEIMSVDFTAYVAAALEQPPVADLVYQQNFSFQQICSVGGTLTGTTKGITTTQGETPGASSGDVALSSAAFSDVKISSTGSSYLRSSNITTQNAWLRYQGQVTVKNIPATGAQVKAELYKISDGNADALSSIARNSSTFSLAHAVGSLGESIPLNGAFKLPEGSDSPSDSYQVRVTIKQNGGTAGTYSLDPGELFLTWQVVSR